MDTKTIVMYGLLIAVIVGGIIYAKNNSVPKEAVAGEYDEFAQCVADSGSTFFGAYWCPHCQDQKALFGTAEQYIPYTECSTPNGQGQTQVCIDAGIESYPTWEGPDGERYSGVQSLSDIAEFSGCTLPGEVDDTDTSDGGSSEAVTDSEAEEATEPEATTEVETTTETDIEFAI